MATLLLTKVYTYFICAIYLMNEPMKQECASDYNTPALFVLEPRERGRQAGRLHPLGQVGPMTWLDDLPKSREGLGQKPAFGVWCFHFPSHRSP